MRQTTSIRAAHRWVAAAFLLTVLVTLVSTVAGGPEWVAYVPLPPLLVLLVTGTVLLVRSFASGRPVRGAVGGAL